MEKKPTVLSCRGIDGYTRPISVEDDLNHLFVTVFSTEAAPKLLDYLRAITVNAVVPSNASADVLRHQEGMRDLFRIINERINKGKEGPHATREQPSRLRRKRRIPDPD